MWYVLGILSRWLLFSGILTAVGSLVFRGLILPKHPLSTRSPDDPDSYDVVVGAAHFGVFAICLLLIGSLGRLAAQFAVFRDPYASLTSELSLLVGSTTWGQAWAWQAVFGIIALFAFIAAGNRSKKFSSTLWILAGLAVFVLALTPAFSGHAYGSERWTVALVIGDFVHVMAAGVWLGTLFVITGTVVVAKGRGVHVPKADLIGWIASFSPLALASAAAIGVTGLLASWVHVDQISSMWTSPYGQRLSLKLAVLLIVLGFGAFHWKRAQDRVQASHGSGRLPLTVAIELVGGLAILFVTAVLVATPMPGE